MITNKELNEVTLSPTKKDYYQIWNELLDLAAKISNRWSPASTNESDPGIVLLKALTAIADKLNYNIDKNTLEAFMPSATQKESMRKLTEMMGYTMKYYQSATCKATITYKSNNEYPISSFSQGILFPKFTNLKNEEEDINYVTLEDFTLHNKADSRDVEIIEGELIECESDNDNIISMIHLDDLNRYILPETAIAENGIFILNVADSIESYDWQKVNNLNTQIPGTKVYKFGFDSESQLPFVQFPDDISTLMEDGLKIKYIRTNGVNGNIAAKIISKLEKPAIWSTVEEGNPIGELTADNFIVSNITSATNGADPESLNAAYNNYKKTIGTFDTLVTCRDYMNKIYQMTESTTDTTPLVSNIIVSDIRDDINRATPLVSFNDYGICYSEVSLQKWEEAEKILVSDKNNNLYEALYSRYPDRIEHFDLILYPFNTVYGLNNKSEYDNSFKYSAKNMYKIEADLATNKNIAHNLCLPEPGDVVCIKNYLRLKAKITTVKKVTRLEEQDILNNIYKAIYTNFNARQLDFGEEIPYETIVEVIKKADYRIKDLSLEEPALFTKFCLEDNTEIDLVAYDNSHIADQAPANRIYNKLALRNILAGKIAAFAYDNDFKSEYNKLPYPEYAEVYPNSEKITKVQSQFDISEAFMKKEVDNPDASEVKNDNALVLKENQVLQFRLPNFKTITTYPAYVNYFLRRNEQAQGDPGVAATFMTIKDYLNLSKTEGEGSTTTTIYNWEKLVNSTDTRISGKVVQVNFDTNGLTEAQKAEKFNTQLSTDLAYFIKDNSNKYKRIFKYEDTQVTNSDETSSLIFYYLPISDECFAALNDWIKQQPINSDVKADGTTPKEYLTGIYKSVGVKDTIAGVCVDENLIQYLPTYKFNTETSNEKYLTKTYVQRTFESADPLVLNNLVTENGLGRSANYKTISKDSEYQLQNGEYLLINYTDSKTDTSGVERKSIINKYYGEGDIIRPNFDIVDSLLYHNNHSYSKRDGFSFNEVSNPEGLFTLGVNEQIEIRDIVQVNLDAENACLYWTLNSDNPEVLTNKFTFTENYGGGTNNAYTLKEGEYLYYTTSQKQNLAYYGAGSIIIKGAATAELIKYTTDGEVSSEEIATNGLMAAIPWGYYNLSGNRSIRVIENQYISLTAGDAVKSVTTSTCASGVAALDNNWVPITGAEYKFAEDSVYTSLPAVNVGNGNISWEARTRLDFNMSKDTSQILNRGDSITLYMNTEDTVVLEAKTEADLEGIENDNSKLVPLCINSNYACQAALDTLDSLPDNFRVKLSKETTLTTELAAVEGETTRPTYTIPLNNYINGNTYYTKISFDEELTNIKLNCHIPSGTFGLVMVYYIPTETTYNVEVCPTITLKENDDSPNEIEYIKPVSEGGGKYSTEELNRLGLPILYTKYGVRPFNNIDYLDGYRIGDASIAGEGHTGSYNYSLQPGINILEISPRVTELTFKTITQSTNIDTIIIGNLDLVKDNELNPKLDYRITNSDNDTTFKQLLADIREIAPAQSFYYNVPTQDTSTIDLNPYVEEDKLSSPLSWYDPNNINNKFVISEIDSSYLTTGITLTKASRV